MSNTTLFTIVRGDDTAFRVRIQDNAGDPVDIRGWTFRATLKLDNFADTDPRDPQGNPDDPGVAVDVEVTGDESSDGANGVTVLLLPSIQTDTLIPALYFFDLQREYANLVSTVVQGRVRVISDVTRRNARTMALAEAS